MNATFSDKICDNKSVGMLIRKGKMFLLIQRALYPFGYAPPAGHVDQHGSYEKALVEEVKEEVGLSVKDFKLLFEKKMNNTCRRIGGSWHYWKVYEVNAKGKLAASKDETKKAGWYGLGKIKRLAKITEKYIQGSIKEGEWEKNPGIETVWYEFFKELKIL